MERYWIWLNELDGLTNKGKQRILDAFGSPEAAWMTAAEDAAKIKGLTKGDKEALRDHDLTRAEEIREICLRKEIGILTCQDIRYPELLRNIPEPPLMLYYAGTLPDFDDELTIGVVGHRKPTENGKTIARKLGYELATAGCIVVSGCAKGVDACAMEGALRAGGTVIGVLGCGVDVVYPQENQWLFETIPQQGCLISEFPPESKPEAWHFPVRNRIISGLSRGVVVAEAPRKSGSLITARLAMDQGRDVFAVPGMAGNKLCAGSNDLLRQGAAFAENSTDVISGYAYLFPERVHLLSEEEEEAWESVLWNEAESLNPEEKGNVPAESFDKKDVDKGNTPTYIDVHEIISQVGPEEAAILVSLQSGPMAVDELVVATGKPTQRILGALTMLQIRGVVEPRDDGTLSLKQIH